MHPHRDGLGRRRSWSLQQRPAWGLPVLPTRSEALESMSSLANHSGHGYSHRLGGNSAPVEGSDGRKAKALMDVAITLKLRIELMLALPLQSLSGLSQQRQIEPRACSERCLVEIYALGSIATFRSLRMQSYGSWRSESASLRT